ncbi:tetratricopeptide repeat protein [Chitinimonas sp.]|uniref:tetratricopeptide repeat protein n=1 Tax=Chitinimonas sp. TaxID=1934313 RepID=UPI0035AE8516
MSYRHLALKLTGFALLALQLGACASLPAAPATKVAAAGEPAKEAAPPEAAVNLEDEGQYPKQALTRELLFGMLLGDIAASQGNRQLGAEAWLQLAQRTHDARAAKRALEIGLSAGRLDIALGATRLWREYEPEAMTARHAMLTLLARSNQLAEVETELQSWLAASPKDAPAVLLQIHTLWPNDADKNALLELTKRISARYPQLPEAQMAIALAERDAGHAEEGEAAADRAIAVRKDWEAAILFRSGLTQQRSTEAAIDYLRQASKQAPASIDIKLSLARLLNEAGRFADAQLQYHQLGAMQPDEVEFPVGEALASLKLRDYAGAQGALERALKLSPKRPAALRYYLAVTMEEQSRLEKARELYRSVDDPEYQTQTAMRLAHIEAKLGQRDAALSELSKLPNVETSDQIARLQVEAQIWRELKDLDRARAVLDQGLQTHKDNADLLYDRSLIFDLLGDVSGAESDLRRYLALNPDSPLALNALGYTLANRTSRLDEAEELIRRALEKEPKNPVIMDSLGWVLVKQGKFADATKLLGQAFSAMPDAEIAAHYGEALWRNGNQEAAKKVWAEGRKIDPKHDVLAETMHRLTGQ